MMTCHICINQKKELNGEWRRRRRAWESWMMGSSPIHLFAILTQVEKFEMEKASKSRVPRYYYYYGHNLFTDRRSVMHDFSSFGVFNFFHYYYYFYHYRGRFLSMHIGRPTVSLWLSTLNVCILLHANKNEGGFNTTTLARSVKLSFLLLSLCADDDGLSFVFQKAWSSM